MAQVDEGPLVTLSNGGAHKRNTVSSRLFLQIDHNVEREIVNHKTLLHPNVIQFREVRSAAEKTKGDWRC
jgi:hypothetical protein